MGLDFKSYRDKRALVTGHTGFKGAWLCLWLQRLGANVSGFALDPPTHPCLFEDAGIKEVLDKSIHGDIRELSSLSSAIDQTNPEVIFHLAAQSLVPAGYIDPIETFSTNVMGTVNLLEVLRQRQKPCVVIVVTSDKCYLNNGQVWGYRECDPMGGDDPYSASKGATELVAHTYRESFFPVDRIESHGVKIATARAGNVIGGGDWAADRIVPDMVRAIRSNSPISVRNPKAVRPWQHVLEPLAGYLQLASRLLESNDPVWFSGWNFGPSSDDARPVSELVKSFTKGFGVEVRVQPWAATSFSEAHYLTLSSEKAVQTLGWRPKWAFSEAVSETASGYEPWLCGDHPSVADVRARMIDSISRYSG